jgi:putative PIN family toxin of toxin-antitoxin system
MAIEGKVEVVVSEPILEEVARVLGGRKFKFSPEVVAAITQAIRDLAHNVHPTVRLKVVKADPDDDKVLECALESSADAIVSGDEHLLALKTFRKIRIITPTKFLESWDEEGSPTIQEKPRAYRVPKTLKRRKSSRTPLFLRE